MTNVRRTLAIKIETPGGDDPLRLAFVASNAPYYRGVAATGIALVARGGTAPYSYSILDGDDTSGKIAGLTPNVDGTFTGTPDESGHFPFVAQVQDSNGDTFPHAFTLDIKAALFVVAGLPTPGEIDVAYSYQFIVEDANGTRLTSGYSILSGGTIPAGLSFTSGGLLSGTPTAPDGTSYFTVFVTDGTDSIEIPCALKIYPVLDLQIAESIDPPSGWGGGSGTWLPAIVRGVDYTATLVPVGGVPPYSYTLSAVDPWPTGFVINQIELTVHGKTLDAASTDPLLVAVTVQDALGAAATAQRAVFLMAGIQTRIIPQRNGIDISGGDGPEKFDLVEGTGISISASNNGDTVSYTINSSAGGQSSIQFKDEGSNLGTAGTATSFDVVGGFLALTRVGNALTLTLSIPPFLESINGIGPDSGGNVSLVCPDDSIEVGVTTAGHIEFFLRHRFASGATVGNSTNVPQITYNAQGIITNATTVPLTLGGSGNAGMMYFGSGIDGDYLLDGTNTYAALSKSGSIYTAQQDIYANNMSFSGTGQLVLNGARLFVYGTLDVSGTSAQPAVAWDAGNGNSSVGAGAGSGANGSAAGAAQTGAGGNGGTGGAGGTAGGNNSSAGGVNASLSKNNGGRGGPGGTLITNSGGSGSSGTGGNSIVNTAPTTFPYYLPYPDLLIKTAIQTVSTFGGGSGGSGGGGGGGSGGGSGGGGGGGGAGGNVAYVAARFIVVTNGLSNVISARGGNGGNGFSTAANNNGGGGGANGGGGGVLHLIYQALTGSGSMTVTASGGNGGNGGTHAGGTATDGKGGTGGSGGLINAFNVAAGTVTTVDQRGTPGSAGSGTTGGTGTATTLTLTP